MYGMGTGDCVTRLYRVLEIVRKEVFVALDGSEFEVTFSAGVAEFPRNGLDLQWAPAASRDELHRR